MSELLPREKRFTTRRPSSLTRYCFVKLAPIAKNSSLLPSVEVWTVSQFQCGWSSSQTSYPSSPWWAITSPTSWYCARRSHSDKSLPLRDHPGLPNLSAGYTRLWGAFVRVTTSSATALAGRSTCMPYPYRQHSSWARIKLSAKIHAFNWKARINRRDRRKTTSSWFLFPARCAENNDFD